MMPLTDANPITSIIKTIDRNLVLLLGHALDAQKFFYSVTYDHWFRDSSSELYQFRPKLTPFVSGELVATPDAHHADGNDEGKSPDHENKDEHDKSNVARGLSVGPADPYEKESSPTTATLVRPRRQASELDETPLLSPDRCIHIVDRLLHAHMFEDQLCYTIGCLRRLEQQYRLNMKPQSGLKADFKGISRCTCGMWRIWFFGKV